MLKAYFSGLIEHDEKKGFKIALELAEKDVVEAQSILAECYDDGIGTEPDEEKKLYWLTKAAQNGDVISQQNL